MRRLSKRFFEELEEELGIEADIVKKAGVWRHNYPFLHVEIHGFIVESSNIEAIQLPSACAMRWISSVEDLTLDWLEADIPIVKDLLNEIQ